MSVGHKKIENLSAKAGIVCYKGSLLRWLSAAFGKHDFLKDVCNVCSTVLNSLSFFFFIINIVFIFKCCTVMEEVYVWLHFY